MEINSLLITKPFEELEQLHTRLLLKIFRFSRAWRCYCSCGPRWHCGDDVLSVGELEHNEKLAEFRKKLKALLDTREHVDSPAESRAKRVAAVRVNRPPEKKRMKY